MRTIKFRAISLCKGEHWVYGDLRHYNRNPHTEKWTIHDPDTGIETDIDETTIGQFTGLADKDGKEIYEGDILKIFYNGKSKIFGVVKYRDTYFFIDDDFERGQDDFIPSKTPIYYMFIKYEFEVVGNIHDNPELLK